MSKSTPSLLALLGLVAVAGYQNRERISDMLDDARQQSAANRNISHSGGQSGGQSGYAPQASGGFLSELGNLFGAGASGGTLSAGLGDLVARFRDAGRAAPADSWVSAKANMPIDVIELEQALGDETLDELGQKTGLSRKELLLRLNAALPDVVNRFTPDGRLPTESEARNFN
jgi:uncharacterized protein YidB (DUF937 family)